MVDPYKNFKELSDVESEGIDYHIAIENRGTDIVVIGIHGGEIEPDTEVIVKNLAGADLSYYLFLGNAPRQHITSTHFDEPRCIDLVSKAKTVVSIHGKSGSGEFVMLGGLDDSLIAKITSRLKEALFEVAAATDGVAGNEPLNICNRSFSGKGLQIEMSRQLRRVLVQEANKMTKFIGAVRGAIQ